MVVTGVQSNYLKIVNNNYLSIVKKSSSSLDIIEEMYATSSSIPKAIISEAYAKSLFYTTDINLEEDSQENLFFY